MQEMLPKPVPVLTKKQWEFIAQRLDKPAPENMQKRLQRAIENAKKIKEE
jgi:hypothetical protein